ncbi:uncharacterized protein ACBT57_021749 [Dama dama]
MTQSLRDSFSELPSVTVNLRRRAQVPCRRTASSVCGYRASDRKHRPRPRPQGAVLASPPRRQEARREGAAFPGGGRPGGRRGRGDGAFVLGAPPRDPPPHRDHEENAGRAQQRRIRQRT